MEETKKDLIADILKREFDMFQNVNTLTRASCQDNPEGFRIMRGSQFSAWSEATLASYREDLIRAEETGRNLMTLKYARMDNLIPPLSESPQIAEIAAIQVAWQQDLAREFPRVLGQGRAITDESAGPNSTSFLRYLAAELETYSEKTLSLLMADIRDFRKRGENMARAIYTAMVRELGYDSLADAEQNAGKKRAV
ncbi:MAG: DUF4125 family protein [Thermodesulfobacteriota bacterium]